MGLQTPAISVNVRFSPEEVAAIDSYAAFLIGRRRTRVTRSDILRLALGRLQVPHDASPELREAMGRIGSPLEPAPGVAKPVQDALPSRTFNPQPKTRG